MKVKAIEILNMFEAFTKLADRELDLNTACNIAKNIKELALSREIIDEKRNKIIGNFAKKDAQNQIVQAENGTVEINDPAAFSQSMTELLSAETEVCLLPIQMASLSGIKISPKDILPLMEIIETNESGKENANVHEKF